jgi:sarcosine oxidase subunit gamma
MAGAAVPVAYDSDAASSGAGALSLVDLSGLPRIGFKGRGTIPAMQARGLSLEGQANRVFRQADGSLVLVLAPSEVIILADPTGQNAAQHAGTFQGWLDTFRLEDTERTYPLLRRDSHAWFALVGPDAWKLLAKVCAIDFRPKSFADLTIAQTSLAKTTAIIARADRLSTVVHHILVDTGQARYLWSCLVDAGLDLQCRTAGVSMMQEHAESDGEASGRTGAGGP